MFGILFLLFTVVPALELYLLFSIGGQIGGLNTVLIVIGTGIIGAALAKSQGLQILMKIQNEVNRGAIPGSAIVQGLMIFAGGLLLITPGFMTDIVGFSLVFPGSRHLLVFFVKKLIDKMMVEGNLNFQTFSAGNAAGFTYTSQQTSGHPFKQGPTSEKLDGDVFEAEYTQKS